ncbi:MAG: hypothetical protein ABW044_07720 [Cellvibrio sp.]
MPYPKLKPDDVNGSREVSFTNRNDSSHPQLMRMCMDYELVVLQVQRRSFSHISKRFLPTSHAFLLSNRDYRNSGLVFSPWFDTLADLELFAKRHHIDILHDHIFGDINHTDLR